MKSTLLPCVLFASIALSAPAIHAQDGGNWRASSTTAKGVTGDIAIFNEKIALGFSAAFPIAQIRTLTPNEITALFNTETPDGTGNLYRLSIPPSKTFLHHNTLCGSDETQWVATFVSGKTLQLAFFSGASIPALTPDALANGSNLCGTYSYVR